MKSYIISALIGLCVYLMMLIDITFIEPSEKNISPKIPLFVTLIVWILCEFILFKPEDVINIPQKIMVGGFYK